METNTATKFTFPKVRMKAKQSIFLKIKNPHLQIEKLLENAKDTNKYGLRSMPV